MPTPMKNAMPWSASSTVRSGRTIHATSPIAAQPTTIPIPPAPVGARAPPGDGSGGAEPGGREDCREPDVRPAENLVEEVRMADPDEGEHVVDEQGGADVSDERGAPEHSAATHGERDEAEEDERQ